jgi:FdhD protein
MQAVVLRVNGGQAAEVQDAIAVEEPLEVRIGSSPFAVLMRTPGHDADLVAGFLFSERIISSPRDLDAIEPCRDADHPEARNVMNVTLGGEAARSLDRALARRRQVVTNSSCGLCGRLTLDAVHVTAPHVDSSLTVSRETLIALPRTLRERQSLFSETGGLHAAGLFDRTGACVSCYEDVGRHNALDKLIGRALLDDAVPLGDRVLTVSGRASYEIVQKAFLAGIPIVAAVSAPSSLAVRLADAAGVTLVGFVRDLGFNVYTHAERVTG